MKNKSKWQNKTLKKDILFIEKKVAKNIPTQKSIVSYFLGCEKKYCERKQNIQLFLTHYRVDTKKQKIYWLAELIKKNKFVGEFCRPNKISVFEILFG